jgi:hypothetical protein
MTELKEAIFPASSFDEDGNPGDFPAQKQLLVLVDGYFQPMLTMTLSDLRVALNLPELGYAVALPLPSTSWAKCTTVHYDYPEYGGAKAIDIPFVKDGKCHNCTWLTGSNFLPCTIDPLSYKLGCGNYEGAN